MLPRTLLTLFLAAIPVWSQTPELTFTFSGSEISSSIQRAWEGPIPPVVFVADGCRDESAAAAGRGHPSVLGQRVREAIRTALRESPEALAQIDSQKMDELLVADAIDPAELCDHRVAAWAARVVGATVLLLPRLRQDGEELLIRTEVIGVADKKGILRFSHRGPVTTELIALLSTLPERPRTQLAPAEKLPDVYRAGRDGIGVPGCLSCPMPKWSKEAEAAEGMYPVRILLRLVVTANGSADRVRVTRGAPFGLSRVALETVRKWRFKPAKDSQGRPVSVWTTIEVLYHPH